MILHCNHHVSTFSVGEVHGHGQVGLGIPLGEYTFIYDYPLSIPARFAEPLTPETTLAELLQIGKRHYEAIYRVESAAIGGKDPGRVPGMLNRATTAGPYGIWGHDLDDLYFEFVDVSTTDRTVGFGMGS